MTAGNKTVKIGMINIKFVFRFLENWVMSFVLIKTPTAIDEQACFEDNVYGVFQC